MRFLMCHIECSGSLYLLTNAPLFCTWHPQRKNTARVLPSTPCAQPRLYSLMRQILARLQFAETQEISADWRSVLPCRVFATSEFQAKYLSRPGIGVGVPSSCCLIANAICSSVTLLYFMACFLSHRVKIMPEFCTSVLSGSLGGLPSGSAA